MNTAGIHSTSAKFTLDDIAKPNPWVANVDRCLDTCAASAPNVGVGPDDPFRRAGSPTVSNSSATRKPGSPTARNTTCQGWIAPNTGTTMVPAFAVRPTIAP